MIQKEALQKLALERNHPCVTISFNTHRTHPDNQQDEIVLKKLLHEAKERVTNEFGKRPVHNLLENLDQVSSEIDVNHNLDSLHIFLSNDTKVIVKSPWETSNTGVHVSESFAVRPLIKLLNRAQAYLIMVLSQSGVHLYEALNDSITREIKNEEFPFTENRHFTTFPDKSSDAKLMDDLLRTYLNKVDKAVVRVHRETGLRCVVICTDDNYNKLLQVADVPDMYAGSAPIDYNNATTHHVSKQAWEIMLGLQQQAKAGAINELHEAVAHGKVITDLQDIYRAAIDGRGDLLIVHQDFVQPVLMTDDRSFDLISDVTTPHAIDDITSNIAWEVLSKHGRVVFTTLDEAKELGEISLKTRY